MTLSEPIKTVTYTTTEAAKRHKGVTPLQLSRLCLRGKYLAKMYGGASRVPAKERDTALFAKKVGGVWQIPETELDRLFFLG